MRLLFAVLALPFAACAHRPIAAAPIAHKVPPLETVRWSGDGSLQLELLAGDPQFRYRLKERESGKILGRAESAIRTDHFYTGEFRGRQGVVFSSDNRAICIVEDMADACPAKRYILFRRMPSGRFATRYLKPALDPDPSIGTFEGNYPDVSALTAETITFSKAVGAPHSQSIDSVPTFRTAQTAIY